MSSVSAASTSTELIALGNGAGSGSGRFEPTLTNGQRTYIPPDSAVRWELGTIGSRTVLQGPNGPYDVPLSAVYGGRDAIRAWAVEAYRSGVIGGGGNHYGGASTSGGSLNARPAPKYTPGEQALVDNAKSERKASRNNAVYEANALLNRWSQGQRTSIEQLPADIGRLTDAKLNNELNAVARKYKFGSWTELLSTKGRRDLDARGDEIRQRALQRVTGITPQVVRTEANATSVRLTGQPLYGTRADASAASIKGYADQTLQKLINARFPQFKGKVTGIEQLAYFQGAQALWDALAGPVTAASSGRVLSAEGLLSAGGRAQLASTREAEKPIFFEAQLKRLPSMPGGKPLPAPPTLNRKSGDLVMPQTDWVGGRTRDGHYLQGQLALVNGSQWALKREDGGLYRVPEGTNTKEAAIRYAKQQITGGRWAEGLRPLDPKLVAGSAGGERSSYLAPLNQQISAASAQIVSAHQAWAQLSAGQTHAQQLHGSAAGYDSLYERSLSALRGIHQRVASGKIDVSTGLKELAQELNQFNLSDARQTADVRQYAPLEQA